MIENEKQIEQLDVLFSRLGDVLADVLEHPELPYAVFKALHSLVQRIEIAAEPYALERAAAQKAKNVMPLALRVWAEAEARREQELDAA